MMIRFNAKMLATDSRLFSPPDKKCEGKNCLFDNPTFSKKSFAFVWASFRVKPIFFRLYETSSRGVSPRICESASWKMSPIFSLFFISIFPLSCFSKPAIIETSKLLPEPFAPEMMAVSPSLIEKEISESAKNFFHQIEWMILKCLKL